MAIILRAPDESQVASASSIEVLMGEPAQRLIICSGIAIPNFWTNHDEEPSSTEVIVKLGIHVAQLERATSHTGLAAIENDETNFNFAVTQGTVSVDESGELQLSVGLVILGEETLIRRFGYQVVAHVRKVSARISGTIAVPRDILDLATLPAHEIAPLFHVTANRIELIPAAPGQMFSSEKIIPVVTGMTGQVRPGPHHCFVDYWIDSCPFNLPLRVLVNLQGRLRQGDVGVGQVAGPNPVTLTTAQPDASGVDFSVGRFHVVR